MSPLWQERPNFLFRGLHFFCIFDNSGKNEGQAVRNQSAPKAWRPQIFESRCKIVVIQLSHRAAISDEQC